MEKKFDYQTSLHLIKSGLFDIYENQEKILGTIEDEKLRNSHLDDFINLKNIALMLIEGIEYLYEDSDEDNNSQKEVTIESSKPEEKQEDKYYLDCDEEKLPFAYVPEQLFLKLKNHQSILEEIDGEQEEELEIEENSLPVEEVEVEPSVVEEETSFEQPQDLAQEMTESSEENSESGYFYKEDDKKVRGIIVRSDQFMKLALSRRRQEGVLEEAREFRKSEVKRKREAEHKKKLEESKVILNI